MKMNIHGRLNMADEKEVEVKEEEQQEEGKHIELNVTDSTAVKEKLG